jgi:hypothetical protein
MSLPPRQKCRPTYTYRLTFKDTDEDTVNKIDSKNSALLAIAKNEITPQYKRSAAIQKAYPAHANWLIQNTVYLAAIPGKYKFVCFIYGSVLELTNQSFIIFAALCLNAYLADQFPLAGSTSRWLHSEDLFQDNTGKYIHRLRSEISAHKIDRELIANDKSSRYSILLPTEDIILNLDRLCQFEDIRVASIARKIKDLLDR